MVKLFDPIISLKIMLSSDHDYLVGRSSVLQLSYWIFHKTKLILELLPLPLLFQCQNDAEKL